MIHPCGEKQSFKLTFAGIPLHKHRLHTSTAQILSAGDSLPLSKKADIALQLAQAMQQVHNLGLVHLDIKPENVLLDQYDGVYLSDFGAAALQQSLSHCMPSAGNPVKGTVNYMYVPLQSACMYSMS